MRGLILGAALIVAGTWSGAAMAQDSGGAPDISPPANNVGDGPSMPNIRLPEGWANPRIGGEGGYVNNGVPAEDMTTPPSAPEDSSGSSDDGDEDGH
jgi:hypothetical protein